ncbi:MAG: uL15 family ribosomal protein [Clostridia bacterium]|nr:uL15 family ribosomal protein [Clostridia bacterium]
MTNRKRTMKYGLIMISAVLLAVTVFSFAASAADDIYSQNVAAANSATSYLGNLADSYDAIESNATKKQAVRNSIIGYRTKIDLLQLDSVLQIDTIELLRLKGRAAGEVTWIYHTFKDNFTGDAATAIDNAYNDICVAIENANVHDELTLGVENGMCDRMYTAIYKEMILALGREGDSDAVNGIIEKALEEGGSLAACRAVTSEENVQSSDIEYRNLYNSLINKINIQRMQDKVMAGLGDVYGILYPDETNRPENVQSIYDSAIASIDDDSTDSAVKANNLLKTAVCALLDTLADGGDYVGSYISDQKTAVSAAVAEANNSGKEVEPVPIFADHDIELARARAKDIIAKDIASRPYGGDETMIALEREYNADSGIIDGCNTQDELDFEIARAALRADLYKKYLDTVSAIDGYVGDSTLKDDALDEYELADYNVKKIDRATDGAADSCTEAYDKGCEKLYELEVEAEVEDYLTDHAEILEKTPSGVTEDDREAILAAVQGITGLSDEAKTALNEERVPDDLAEKYKKITADKIGGIVGNTTPLREKYLGELTAQVNALDAEDDCNKLADVVTDADRIEDKAEEVDRVLDRYDEITAEDGYESFADADKTKLEGIADSASDGIVKASDETNITKAADDATVELNRARACAEVDAKASERDDLSESARAEADKTVADAKEKIAGLTDADEIDKAADDAVFALAKIFDVNDATEKVDNLKAKVESLGFLDATAKDGLKSDADGLLEDAKKAVADAETYDELEKAISDFEAAVTELETNSDKQDSDAEKAQKDAAVSELETEKNELKEKIDGLAYLTKEEKADLKNSADRAFEDAKSAVDAADSTDTVNKSKDAALTALDTVSKEADDRNAIAKHSQAAEAEAELRNKYDDVEDEISNLDYLTSAEKELLKKEATDAIEDFIGELAKAESMEDIRAAKADAYGALDAVLTKGKADNLAAAKESATGKLKAEKNKTDKLVDDFAFLKAEDQIQLKADNQAMLDAALAEIDAAESIDAVSDAHGDGAKKLSDHRENAQNAEDNACVNTLMPAIIALSALAVAEGAALLVLSKVGRKAKAHAYSFVPVTALAAVAPPVISPIAACILLIVLALADLFMAVLIVRLILKIERNRKRARLEEVEPEPAVEEVHDDLEVFDPEIITEPEPESVPEPVEEPAPAPVLVAVKQPDQLEGRAPRARLEPATKVTEWVSPIVLPEVKESVTVEEAEELMTDEEAALCEQTDVETGEIYTGKKRAEINIDTIGRHFEAGEIVTLNTLKEKKLIAKSAGFVKILARGSLDKPLTVVAQSFSAAAVKMIVLTGGQTIVVEGSPERGRK